MAGVADAVRAAGIACFGPSAAAAQIEGSKAFAKQVMAAAGVPTARSRVAEAPDEVDAALAEFGPPYVVKDDGLAAGKGVLVTDDLAAARDHAAACRRVVIEEFLDGPEVSLFAITDGVTVRAAAAGPGLQAGRRRRLGPQHRRHGRVHPVALGPGGPDGRGHHDRAAADGGRVGPAGDALRRTALRRSGADRPRGAGDRVQRPVRRPGDPAAAGPADHAAGRPAVRRRDRQPGRPARAGLDRRCRRRRGAGRGELPGSAGHRRPDHRAGRRPRRRVRWWCTPVPPWTPRAGWSAAAAGCSAWWAPEPISTWPGSGPTGGSARSACPAPSTAPTSPPGCRRPRRPRT